MKRLILILLCLATYCVKDHPKQSDLLFLPPPGPRLAGEVVGLEHPGLVLQSGEFFLSLERSGPFQFQDRFYAGQSYDVVLSSVPAGYLCTVKNGSGVITDDVADLRIDCLNVATVLPADQSVIQPTDPIQIRFTRSMSTCTIPPSGMGADAHSIAWSSTNAPQDTLTITPTATWNAGTNRILQLANCNDSDGNFILSTGFRFLVATDARYVSSAGNDSGGSNDCSSPVAPCATIAHAMSQASGCGGGSCAILITEGTFDQGGTALGMASQVSLMGGYSSDFSARNPWSNSTRIVNGGTGCGGISCTVRFPGGVDANTTLDGIHIEGPAGSNTAAVYFMGGGTLHNVRLDPGTGSVSREGTVVSTPPVRTTRLEFVRILPNNGSIQNGLGVRMDSGNLQIYASFIRSSSALQRSIAVEINGGNGRVDSSFLFSGASGQMSHALEINFAGNWVIGHNYLRSDSGGGIESVALDINSAPSGPLYNNLIQAIDATNRYCVRDLAGLPSTVTIANNNLWGCGDALMRTSSESYTEICSGGFGHSGCASIYSGATVNGQVPYTPSFVDGSSDFRFAVSNPCAVSNGGVDPASLSQPILPDATSRPRPGADGFFSIGPIEAHLECSP